MKKINKKLNLKTKTIRALTQEEARRAMGGGNPEPQTGQCLTHNDRCDPWPW